MLVIPYVTAAAAAAGFSATDTLIGLAGILLIHIGRPSLMLLLKRRVKQGDFGNESGALVAGFTLMGAPGVAIFAWLWLGRGLSGLPWLGMAGAALFLFYTALSLKRRERAALSEFAGIALLTFAAPLGCYLAAGDLDLDRAAGIWILNSLYFGVSVYYVKMKMRAKAGRRHLSLMEKLALARRTLFYLAFMVPALVLTLWAGLAPYLSALAYLPIFVYTGVSIATLGPGGRIRQEGWRQAAISLAFAMLLVISYRF
ncbi:MAG: YwiC-like family protein [Thermoleophilia bacterium]|nr:YwiC-like family protein [Thermoleophilia bacterium]